MTCSFLASLNQSIWTAILIIKSSATKTFQWPPKTEIAAIKAWRYDSPSLMESEMVSRTPSIIDLNAEVAKLTMVRRTPQSGKDHWESHPGDELIHILDGTATLEIVCDDGPPKSFVLRAGMMAVIPQGTWHRFHSSEGATQMAATPFPGEHIELDVDDPRTVERKPA